jgi:hypothetical protein
MRIFVIMLSIAASLVVASNVLYLRATTSDEIKARCRAEKRDIRYENRFIDCLARKGR